MTLAESAQLTAVVEDIQRRIGNDRSKRDGHLEVRLALESARRRIDEDQRSVRASDDQPSASLECAVPTSDPVIQRLSSLISSNSRHAGAGPAKRKPAIESIVPDQIEAAYRAEVDPDGQYDERERTKRANAAFRRDCAVEELRIYKALMKSRHPSNAAR